MKASATGFTRSPNEPQPDVVVEMNRKEAAELAASLEHCVSCLLGGHRHPNAEKTLQLLDALKLVLERPPEISRGTTPSVGKGGTNGCFMVEIINHTGTRALARRFKTLPDAESFYNRTVEAYQSKADRERHWYVIAQYETATPKSTEIFQEHRSTLVNPR